MPEILSKAALAMGMGVVLAKSTLSYYLKGPRCPKWPLWFQLHRDVIHRVIRSGRQPADHTAEEIDFARIAAENQKWDLPESQLPPEFGSCRGTVIRVADVLIDPAVFAGTGSAESRLVRLTMDDRTVTPEREIPCEVTVPSSLGDGEPAEDSFAIAPLHEGERIILFLHGGAYKFGSYASHRALTGRIAYHAGLRCLTFDYRLAPLHPYPAQLHDAFIAFSHLVQQGFAPGNIVFAGDSAGGNLALSLTLLLRHIGVDAICGLLLLSPWSDLTTERPSLKRNAKYDFLSAPPLSSPLNPARTFYAPGRRLSQAMLDEMAHPLVSPVYADFGNFPPTLIQAGEKEIIIDEISQLYENIVTDNPGAASQNHVYECYADMVHVFHQFLNLPDAQLAIARAGGFIKSLC